MLKITEYAERLINDLDDLDYIERLRYSKTGSAARGAKSILNKRFDE